MDFVKLAAVTVYNSTCHLQNLQLNQFFPSGISILAITLNIDHYVGPGCFGMSICLHLG